MYFWTEVDAHKSVKYVSTSDINHERVWHAVGMRPHSIIFHSDIKWLAAVNPSARRLFLWFRLKYSGTNATKKSVQ
jgi:hypothetical protein